MIVFYILLVVTGLAFAELDRNCTDIRINNGPLITPCVSEVILQNGQNYTLTCKGTTKLNFRQQDISEEVTNSNFIIENKTSTIFEDGYTNEITLELFNVDRYAIGFYACTDEYVDSNIVNSILEEPKNNEHVAYIYVYVNGTDSLFAPMTEIIISRSNKILIECRPTTPDVTVELSSSKSQNKTPKYSPKIGFVLKSCSNAFTCKGQRGDRNDTKMIRIISEYGPPKPKLFAESPYFLKNRQFTLNCSVETPVNTIAILSWTYPKGLNMDSQDFELKEGKLYKAITIYNPTKLHEGVYTCQATNGCLNETASITKKYLSEPLLNMSLKGDKSIETTGEYLSKNFMVDAFPEPTYKILKNGIEVPTDRGKYKLQYRPKAKYTIFVIDPCDITDNANFTLVASNGVTKNASFVSKVNVGPTIDFGMNHKTCIKGMITTIRCDVAGFPIPNITWIFSNTTSISDSEIKTVYKVTAFLKLTCDQDGTIACHASNKYNNTTEVRRLLVYEITDGFGISDKRTAGDKKLVIQNDTVSIKCLASLFDFSNVTWFMNDHQEAKGMVEYPNPTNYSHVAVLKINNIDLDHSGYYRCEGLRNNGSKTHQDIKIEVIERKATVIEDPLDIVEDVHRFEIKNINCIAVGAPLPRIDWYKDDEPLVQDKGNLKIHSKKLNHTTIQSTIEINQTQEHNLGKYDCVAKSDLNTQKKSFTLNLKVDKAANMYVKHYVIAIVVIIIMLIILVVYLGVKIRKEKQFKKELSAAGLLYFKKGVTQSLNPDLGIDEQAELLPYDERFEFPADKLIYGKQLGAGAFGVVYKAEARGIVNAEETTLVAVKMVKKTADNMYIKALASELKIMVHLGKHINIVNLLGACTKKVGKRELVVIVEYCKYGNIHNYMQRHREVFIDQLDTDNKEKLGRVNRAYTSSSCGSTGGHSDYFGSTNTQDTEHTMLNTANTVQSVRKNIPNNNLPMEEVKASEGYVQPEWRSNYETDYSYDGRSPRPLTSRDLLAWAFQIARGMEYLASRKVLHGDLAARNILLAEDNVVKICDFGLAKSIYKNDEYQKKENCLLPVKWLAIECMTDRIFSTQSDVWSFGIVLWELFTLAKTPYPNLSPADILPFLNEGHRLDKPAYADNRIYDVMKKCWEAKPTMRPTFTQLQEILGTFLEDNVRNHYVDLNSTNMDNNTKAGQDDYLAMVCAPDYNNLVTPSPHQYVNANNSFFPLTPDRVDGEGYLQMSPRNQGIFSPRDPNTEFNFDAMKFNHKNSESSSCGSELTPMLSLNNLPARTGSESDHEGNSSYLSACPPIVEEADEVFEVTKNLNDTNNIKNLQQSAVTNPTYITFENVNEKPKDINNYVNINVPNGLVK